MIWELASGPLDFAARAHVMGILNATPDSFYDGGRYQGVEAAVASGVQMLEDGADIIDVGGESSRPPMYGEAIAVDVEEECRRVVPVIEKLRRQTSAPISIDTVKAEVARRALDAGADIINDISALEDEEMARVAAAADVPVILMHRRGSPSTMQLNTHYEDLLGEVYSFLAERVAYAREMGIDAIAVDPGLGFGKSPAGNLGLLRNLSRFAKLNCPLLLGASRKSFIWKTLGLTVEDSLEGSLALAVLGRAAGAHLLRVHDVGATCRALCMTDAVLSADLGA
jgi:dihydropteroate synthase